MINVDIVEREDGRFSPAKSLPSRYSGEPQLWTREGYYAQFNDELVLIPNAYPIFDKNGEFEVLDDNEQLQIAKQLGNIVSHGVLTTEIRINDNDTITTGIRGGGMEHITLGTIDESGAFNAVVCLFDIDHPLRANNNQIS